MSPRVETRDRLATFQSTTRPEAETTPAAPEGPGETTSDAPTTTAAPSPDTVRTSRAQLRHDPRTAQFRQQLDQRLDDAPAAFAPVSPELENAFPQIVRGTNEADDIVVSQADDGSVEVTNHTTGDTRSYTEEEAKNGIVIAAGDGDDSVTIDGSVDSDVRITVAGGDGADTIDGSAYGGQLRVDGGAGNDEIIGGRGRDRLEGGDGDDLIRGGAGDDQVIGQGGDDQVFGEGGDDLVQGSDGADVVYGGEGSDALYADADDVVTNAGDDITTGGGLAPTTDGDVDTIITEEGHGLITGVGENDVVVTYDREETEAWLAEHPEYAVEGDEDFTERTVAELGAIRSTDQGRGLLDDLSVALQEKGETITFEERFSGPGGGHDPNTNTIDVGGFASTYDAEGANRHPLPVLFHELVHAYQNHVSGNPSGATELEDGSSVRNIELQATGLPWYDEEGNLHAADELPYTDNRFREELGLPTREGYAGSASPPVGPGADDGTAHSCAFCSNP
ncbi:MAG: M91 family zinc metallopeptidase [Deltaproteobacteria bacterium]